MLIEFTFEKKSFQKRTISSFSVVADEGSTTPICMPRPTQTLVAHSDDLSTTYSGVDLLRNIFGCKLCYFSAQLCQLLEVTKNYGRTICQAYP